MNYLNKKILDKIGFYYVLEKLSVSSAFGKDILYNLSPINESEEITAEYNNINNCFPLIQNSKLFNNLMDIMRRFKDIRNTFYKCKKGLVLDEVELYEIKYFAKLSIELKELYENSNVHIKGVKLKDFSNIFKLLNPSAVENSSFYIYDHYSEKLKDIRNRKKYYDKNIFKEADEQKQKLLYIERQDIIKEEKEEELKIKEYLSMSILKHIDELLEETIFIGKIEVTIAKAKLAIDYNMCCPELSKETKLKIINGINPMVKEQVESRKGKFTAISIEVYNGSTVITGANMGGKTVLLSIAALNYLLASTGFYAFADEFEFAKLDFIYYLAEDAQSTEKGLSSFGADILELKKILETIKKEKGLIILDEFARGTNPFEGSNITKTLVSYMNRYDSICLIATHYDRVCSFAKLHYQVRGLKYVDFKALKRASKEEEDYLKLINQHMDYSLEQVHSDAGVPKDALNICILMGLDDEFIDISKGFYDI